jgi:hypothetical protein
MGFRLDADADAGRVEAGRLATSVDLDRNGGVR